jgi:hypothetical protein
MSFDLATSYRIHAKDLRERARGVMDNNRRREMIEEAYDIELLADDIADEEREKAEADQ